jgi:hypothetical protein
VPGFILGIASFAVALSTYSIAARVRRARGPASARPSLMLLVGVVLLIVSIYCLVIGLRSGASDAIVAVMVALSLTVAFVAANTAIETDSPTQSIVLFLHAHGNSGVDDRMLDVFIRDRPFRDSRLNALIQDGVVERENGRLVCRPVAQVVLRCLDSYRRIIRRKQVVTG